MCTVAVVARPICWSLGALCSDPGLVTCQGGSRIQGGCMQALLPTSSVAPGGAASLNGDSNSCFIVSTLHVESSPDCSLAPGQ